MLKPKGDRVLVKMDKVEKTKSGLWLPQPASVGGLKCWTGTVLAKGKGKHADYIEVGQKVLIERLYKMPSRGEEIGLAAFDCGENDFDGEGHLLIDAEHILGVVEE
jgi:co-chaperonin GroES (HSP10)